MNLQSFMLATPSPLPRDPETKSIQNSLFGRRVALRI